MWNVWYGLVVSMLYFSWRGWGSKLNWRQALSLSKTHLLHITLGNGQEVVAQSQNYEKLLSKTLNHKTYKIYIPHRTL